MLSLILVAECRSLHEFLLENRTEFDSLRAPRVRREKSVFDFGNLGDFAQQACSVYNETIIRKVFSKTEYKRTFRRHKTVETHK